jgi:hypothetical protein
MSAGRRTDSRVMCNWRGCPAAEQGSRHLPDPDIASVTKLRSALRKLGWRVNVPAYEVDPAVHDAIAARLDFCPAHKKPSRKGRRAVSPEEVREEQAREIIDAAATGHRAAGNYATLSRRTAAAEFLVHFKTAERLAQEMPEDYRIYWGTGERRIRNIRHWPFPAKGSRGAGT